MTDAADLSIIFVIIYLPSTGTSSPEFMSYLHGLGGKAVVTMLGTCRLSRQDRCTSCQKTAEEYQLDIDCIIDEHARRVEINSKVEMRKRWEVWNTSFVLAPH